MQPGWRLELSINLARCARLRTGKFTCRFRVQEQLWATIHFNWPTAEGLARYGSRQQLVAPGKFEWKLIMANWVQGRSKFIFDLHMITNPFDNMHIRKTALILAYVGPPWAGLNYHSGPRHVAKRKHHSAINEINLER